MFEGWDDLLSRDEKVALERQGFGSRSGFGTKPALLVIDAQYSFVGTDSPLKSSTQSYPKSSGDVAWRAVEQIRELIGTFHKAVLPVIYSKAIHRSVFNLKARATKSSVMEDGPRAEDIVDEIAPADSDIIIEKSTASCFQGTPLLRILRMLGTDSVVVTGGTTSGCVRASVVDAFSSALNPVVVPEATFDRIRISHRVSLLDMGLKYADLLSVKEVGRYIRELKT